MFVTFLNKADKRKLVIFAIFGKRSRSFGNEGNIDGSIDHVGIFDQQNRSRIES